MDSTPALPFQTHLSLAPLVTWWCARAVADPEGGMGRFATSLLTRVGNVPELLADDPAPDVLAAHSELVEALFIALIPPAAHATTLSGAIAPFDRQVLFATPTFRHVMVTGQGQLKSPLNVTSADLALYLTRTAYTHILSTCYGEPVAPEENVLFTVPDYSVGLYRHYKVELNQQFLEVEGCEGLPSLSADERRTLRESQRDLAPWRALLPPERFTFRGFLMLHLADVTETQILSNLKNDLLARDVLNAPDRLEQLQEQLRALFRQPSLQLGLAGYKPRAGTFETFNQRLGLQTVSQHLVTNVTSAPGPVRRFVEERMRAPEPLIVPDVTHAADLPAEVRAELHRLRIHALALCPLRYGNDVLGILELSAERAGALPPTARALIEQFLPLFAVAVHRHQDAEWAQVQAIVKERFTAIHPALEWRFVDAAEDLIAQQRAGVASPQLRPIIFPDVYPLYAAIDVRGSSAARAEAVRADLTEQLHLAYRVLMTVAETQPLPIVEEMRYFAHRNLQSLREGLAAEDEVTILDTFRTEVEPLFEFLRGTAPEARVAIQRYWSAIDGRRGIVYRQRRAFEESLTQINEQVSALIDAAEQEAQRTFPHYFRRSVTDGVEFDIYVGASLVENQNFDAIILKNLRLWQLRTLVEVAKATAALRLSLPAPLQTTQLLLIHSQPLAVRFREDERQFDVDGAWNARYEIIKKRIDKATYLDTNGESQRLTQPGAIAIVYQQPREAAEYEEYLAYLRERNLLTAETERLDLEEAQGIRGLHALRVWVA